MENKEDWKKVEEDILNKDSEKIANYGVDIIGELDNLIKKNNNVKRKKIKKIIKISFRSFMILIIIFAVALLMFGFYLYDSMFKSRHDVDPTEFIEAISEEKVKCISKNVDNNKNGLYEYRPKSNKEIVIHAVKKFGKTDSDVIEQYFKYYFEKWSDEYKDKFVIKQGYKECEIYPEETSQWLLSYSVYAEIHNFIPLFECPISVYLWREHPLADRREISIEQLAPYPCISFDQGEENSFYFAEEVMSTYHYRQVIRVSDRATILNMMVGLRGYTLCSGIICEELNGDLYRAVPLRTEEKMTIGYIKKKQVPLSSIAQKYLEELKTFI